MSELAIIQLSDIHLSAPGNSNWIWKHRKALYDTACNHIAGSSQAILVVSGDIAQSGSRDEYDVALDLFSGLAEELARRSICEDLSIVTTPGNHDHNFRTNCDLRNVLLGAKDEQLTETVIDQITQTQNEYFAFAHQIEKLRAPISGYERLCRVRSFEFGGESIVFNLLNTSWTSTKHEEYGALRWSRDVQLNDSGDHVITVLHHPLAWLNPTDAHSLRTRVESASDLIITGHIHSSAARTQTYTSGQHNHTLESGALQERAKEGQSEFHVYKFDLAENTQRSVSLSLRDSSYICTQQNDQTIPLNTSRSTTLPKLAKDFESTLSDAGHGLNHPRKHNLQIEDFFVMPYLLKAGDGAREDRLVKANVVTDTLKDSQSLVVAPEAAGKSSFAKAMFRSFRNIGLVPVIIHASTIAKRDRRAPIDMADKAAVNIYDDTSFPSLSSWLFEKRVLIIDDLHEYRFSSVDLREFLGAARSTFSTIVCTATPDYLIQDLVDKESHAPGAIELEQYQLLEFGHRQRHELIQRWCSIGLDHASNQEDFDRTVNAIEQHIDSAIRKNFIPPYPSYLVLMLQSIDAHQVLDPTLGAYGQLYQCVIYQHLYSGDNKIDTDTKSNFLAALAAWSQSSPDRSISLEEAKLRYADFSQEYALSTTWKDMWDSIERTRLIRLDGDLIKFRYRFVGPYFYSLHIAQQLEGNERTKAIAGLVDTIHLDESCSTLLCLLQHTKDRMVVDIVLKKAQSIFPTHNDVRDINTRSKFINDWINDLPTIVLSDGGLGEVRCGQLDDLDEQEVDHKPDTQEEKVGHGDAMSDMAAGYRIVQVMGQILRAFSGSLKATQKADLCKECFAVAMRTMDFYLQTVEAEKDELAISVAENLREAYPAKRVEPIYQKNYQEMIAKETSRRVFYLVEMFGVNVFRHLSNAIGTDRLDPTLREVLDMNSSTDRLIDMAIKLDHYRDFPKSQIDRIVDGTESRYTAAITRDLVWMHLHLVDRKRELRQQMCEKLGIRLVPRLLYNKEIKKLS